MKVNEDGEVESELRDLLKELLPTQNNYELNQIIRNFDENYNTSEDDEFTN